MAKLKNIKIDEVTLCQNPKNDLSRAAFVKSEPVDDEDKDKVEASEDDEDKVEAAEPVADEDKVEASGDDEPQDQDEADKAQCPECDGVEGECECPAPVEAAEPQDEVAKAMGELAELRKAVAAMTMEKAVATKVALIKSLGCPVELTDSIAKQLVEYPAVEASITALLKSNQSLRKASKLYEEVGSTTAEDSGKALMAKAKDLFASGQATSMTQATAMVRAGKAKMESI